MNPAGPGNLRGWAYSTPPVGPPSASILNYAAVSGLNIANGLAVPLCTGTPSDCPFDLRVQADGSGTHLVMDIVGYFYDSPLSWSAVRTDSVASAAWTTIPGLALNIRLPGPAVVHTVASGTQRAFTSVNCHQAYRLLIDGNPLGEAQNGQRIQVSSPTVSHWHMWSFSHSVNLAAGDHTIAVQTRESGQPSAQCVVCGEANGSTTGYSECSVNATAIFQTP